MYQYKAQVRQVIDADTIDFNSGHAVERYW